MPRRLVVASPLVVLSLHRPLLVSSCQMVAALPLVVPLSRSLIVPHSRPLYIISLHRPLVVSSRQLVVGRLSLRRPLVVLSLHCSLIILRRLVVLMPLVAPPFRPLVACRLVVEWPPKKDAATIKCPATTAATAKATVGDGTTTTVVELTIVHCLRKRQQQHNHQCTNGSTNAKTFTSPDNLDLFNFNLSTVY